jgi:four helix bundle protein
MGDNEDRMIGSQEEIVESSRRGSERTHAAYKDLAVWQKSMLFASELISLIENLETDRKHYRLVEQLEAAATSIPMNIAEGKGRYSQKEFIHYLHIARGSLYETLTLLELFEMRGWVKPEWTRAFWTQAEEIGKMINGLIRSIS